MVEILKLADELQDDDEDDDKDPTSSDGNTKHHQCWKDGDESHGDDSDRFSDNGSESGSGCEEVDGSSIFYRLEHAKYNNAIHPCLLDFGYTLLVQSC